MMIPAWVAIIAFILSHIVGGVLIGALVAGPKKSVGIIQIWDDKDDGVPYLFLDMDMDILEMQKYDGKELLVKIKDKTK